MRGIFLINHSPKPRTEAPNHDDINTPMRKMKVREVKKPSPANLSQNCNKKLYCYLCESLFIEQEQQSSKLAKRKRKDFLPTKDVNAELRKYRGEESIHKMNKPPSQVGSNSYRK